VSACQALCRRIPLMSLPREWVLAHAREATGCRLEKTIGMFDEPRLLAGMFDVTVNFYYYTPAPIGRKH